MSFGYAEILCDGRGPKQKTWQLVYKSNGGTLKQRY